MIDFSSRPGWAPVPHEVRQDDPGWQLIQLPGIRLYARLALFFCLRDASWRGSGRALYAALMKTLVAAIFPRRRRATSARA